METEVCLQSDTSLGCSSAIHVLEAGMCLKHHDHHNYGYTLHQFHHNYGCTLLNLCALRGTCSCPSGSRGSSTGGITRRRIIRFQGHSPLHEEVPLVIDTLPCQRLQGGTCTQFIPPPGRPMCLKEFTAGMPVYQVIHSMLCTLDQEEEVGSSLASECWVSSSTGATSK
jgi:hypothetical protein